MSRQSSRSRVVLRRVWRRPTGKFAIIFITCMVIVSLISFIWTPYDPYAVDPAESWAPWSARHIFGADALGRDIASRLMVGANLTLFTTLAAVTIASVAGLLLAGLIAFSSRPVGKLLERGVDLLIAFPTLLIALILATATGGTQWGLALAIGIGSISTITRTILPELRRSMRSDHVTLAVTSGASRWWLLDAHILPDVAATLLIRMTQLLGIATLAEAGLSYLGLGAPPSVPSWGRMLAEHQEQIYSRPQVLAAPAALIILAILSFNLLGDALRDALAVREEEER